MLKIGIAKVALLCSVAVLLTTTVTLAADPAPESGSVSLSNALKGVTAARSAVVQNVTNAKAIGFKRNLVRFVEGSGVSVVRDFSQGELIRTNRPLDVAVEGEGYLKVGVSDGGIRYTRRGDLCIDADGRILLSTGELLEPTITIPPNCTEIRIKPDGLVTGTLPEASRESHFGMIQLATFPNPGGLSPEPNGLFSATESSGEPTLGVPSEGSFGTFRGGCLECSNVKLDEETRILAELHSYESQLQTVLDATAPQLSAISTATSLRTHGVVQAGYRRPAERQADPQRRVSVIYELSTLPVFDQAPDGKLTHNASLLIDAIKSSIEPESWDDTTLIREDGYGTLMVTHTPEVHRRIETFMGMHTRDGKPPEAEEIVRPVFE